MRLITQPRANCNVKLTCIQLVDQLANKIKGTRKKFSSILYPYLRSLNQSLYNLSDRLQALDVPSIRLTFPQIRVPYMSIVFSFQFFRLLWVKYFWSTNMANQMFAAILLLTNVLSVYAQAAAGYN